MRVSPEELEEGEEGVLAILPNDQVVELIEWMRIRVGHGGATVGGTSSGQEWGYRVVSQAPIGLYERMKQFPGAVAQVRAERVAAGKRLKRWDSIIHVVGHEALTCPEIAAEVVEDGWLDLLRSFRV
jgi:hypothetical protein